MDSTPHQIGIFGSSGQIGRSMLKFFQTGFGKSQIIKLGHTTWHRDKELLFRSTTRNSTLDIFFASGLTDPGISKERLLEANFEFPVHISAEINALRPQARFITLGTVHENMANACDHNNYFYSKREFHRWLNHPKQGKDFYKRWTHLQLHTLYSLPMAPHRFLGQMTEAIRSNSDFLMSSGEQLREYQPIELLSEAISALLLNQNWTFEPTQILSLGEPLELREITRSVFEHLGKKELLKVGALKSKNYEPTRESLECDPDVKSIFKRSPDWLLGKFSKLKSPCTLDLFLDFIKLNLTQEI
jgi:hypothetical protein